MICNVYPSSAGDTDGIKMSCFVVCGVVCYVGNVDFVLQVSILKFWSGGFIESWLDVGVEYSSMICRGRVFGECLSMFMFWSTTTTTYTPWSSRIWRKWYLRVYYSTLSQQVPFSVTFLRLNETTFTEQALRNCNLEIQRSALYWTVTFKNYRTLKSRTTFQTRIVLTAVFLFMKMDRTYEQHIFSILNFLKPWGVG